jgi:putative heme iron utilization protein
MLDDTAFDPIGVGRTILRTATTASLGTLDETGAPFVTLVTIASLADRRPVLHLSELAVHTRNCKHNDRVSLLLVAPGGEDGNPLAGARITLTGRLVRIDTPHAAARYAARHGGTQGFADFHHYALDPGPSHLIAGFGRIVPIAAAELFPEAADCAGLIEGETGIVDHMNADHGEAIALYATRLLGLPDGAWRITGCDPDGIDLIGGRKRARLDFPTRATSVAEAGGHLKAFAKAARAAA